MKVNDLIKYLEKVDPEADIDVAVFLEDIGEKEIADLEVGTVCCCDIESVTKNGPAVQLNVKIGFSKRAAEYLKLSNRPPSDLN